MFDLKKSVKKEWFLVGGMLVVLWCVVGILGAAWWLNRPTGATEQIVAIEPGMTVPQIGHHLYTVGLIRSPH
ncbi:MAG: hypothetical protein HOH77_05845, partial [Candidatus Latescibacteria bacterium]|nr:hypothetical protein [Candidatus Latescibacterota bacterium]